MRNALKAIGLLVGVGVLGLTAAVQTATVVRQARPVDQLKVNGVAEKTRTDDALDYSVAISIAAPPPIVWALLTEAKAYPQWNSTIVKIDGTIAKAETIRLVTKLSPERTFELKVSELEKGSRMVWADGGKAFSGVRTFTLLPNEGGGTTFAMSETFSGRFLPMIEGSLPDFTPAFNAFAADLKAAAEKVAPPMEPAAPPAGEAVPVPEGDAADAGS